uniref:Neurocan n=1 Tax=Cyanoderma ruficeps TaxID=181631 RepID=A0A8C3NQ20_9PASS
RERHPKSRGHNWHKFQGHCYRYFPRRRSWEDAERDCRRRAGHLASIHSPEEHAFITGAPPVPASPPLPSGRSRPPSVTAAGNTWIGLNDRIVEQDFQWTDNTGLVRGARGVRGGGLGRGEGVRRASPRLLDPEGLGWMDEGHNL